MRYYITHMARTKLHEFMEREGITDIALVRESGLSPRHISKVKLGHSDATSTSIGAILDAARRLTGRKAIRVTDLFEFEQSRERKAS